MLLLLSSLSQAQVSTFYLIVQPESRLAINGKTNVNKYTCSIARYAGSDTLVIKGERGKGAIFSKGIVKLIATEFDCNINFITNDFQKTINAEEYPHITIDFLSFGQEPTFQATEEKFKGKMRLSLAGKSKPVEIRCAIKKDEKGYFHLTGRKDFNFSDFGLKPPSKMLGTVKVQEKITVNFHLVIRRV
jgi:hypothetical protein